MGRWIVACAWPYINAVPHLGTLVQLLSADVYARYLRKAGEDVVFISGSDEHGTPIEVEAMKKRVNPRELTDKMHNYFLKLIDEYGISFDNYTRTESPVHISFVREFYMKVYENGYVFEKESEQLFCQRDGIFLPDRFVEGKCPYCGYERAKGDQCEMCGRLLNPTDLIDPRCVICGERPVIKSTKHWYFDLPKLEKELIEYISNTSSLPENARSMSLSMIREGLRPRSLTRDNKWGIPSPFPGSEGKTIYVWMEAVLGYISATKEYFEKIGRPDEFNRFWRDKDTKSVYFIGKDNIPFHVVILPALIMASKEGYVLPFNVSSTEFLNYEGDKFSKSRRWGVWLDEALLLLEADYWRYYLIAIRPETKDSNFSWRDFEMKINSELNDILGNFVHRTLTFLRDRYESRIPEAPLDNIMEEVYKTSKRVVDELSSFKLRDSLRSVMDIARIGNRYLNESEPWRKYRENRKEADKIIKTSIQIIKTIAIYIEPFMPFSAEKIWKMLNLEGSVHEARYEDASDEVPGGHKIAEVRPLFNKVKEEELREKLDAIRRGEFGPLMSLEQ
ncbi:MAG: methionine--tRNA ligase [Candidatus Methanodesulfokora sp.]